MYYRTDYNSPIGNIILASSENGLTGLWFKGQKYECKTLPPENVILKSDFPVLVTAKQWLDDYFNKMNPDISILPLEPAGTEFQKAVWDILYNSDSIYQISLNSYKICKAVRI